MSTPLSGGYCGGVPPLPIPNREVKPTCADGTAMQCGRVGSRLFSSGAPRIQCPRGSFFVLVLFPSLLSVKSPPRKFPSCALQEALFLSTLIASCHPLFIHLQRKRPPCPCCPSLSSASYPSRILTLKARLFDADFLVT